MVGIENEMYARTFCGFIASAVIKGEQLLADVECQARIAPGTDQHEREHAEFLSRYHSTTSTSQYWYLHHYSGTEYCYYNTRKSTTCSSTTTNRSGSAAEVNMVILDADAKEFHVYLDSMHDVVQLLHQAYVYSFKYVLLLINKQTQRLLKVRQAL